MKAKMLLAAIVGAIVILGPQLALGDPAKKSNQESPDAPTYVMYSPEGREQFVFVEKAENLQKYGYDGFCKDTKTFACMNKLPYEKYVGVRGYFVSEEPAHSDSYGYDFYPVVLDTGEQFYFVVTRKRGKYGGLAPVMPLAQYLELKTFKPEPLIPGSAVELVEVEQSYGGKSFKLSNGKLINEKALKSLRELCAKFGNKPALAELLLDVEIEKDEIENRYFVQPSGNILRSEAKLYIGIKESKVWMRFKVKYYGDDWLFVSGYKVAADEYRWQSPQLKFERDHSSGSVWEWSDVAAGAKEVEVAKALSSAQNATIRFQGKQYYADRKLEEDQKKALKTILGIYKEIGGGA